jgi:hypothetical protein
VRELTSAKRLDKNFLWDKETTRLTAKTEYSQDMTGRAANNEHNHTHETS